MISVTVTSNIKGSPVAEFAHRELLRYLRLMGIEAGEGEGGLVLSADPALFPSRRSADEDGIRIETRGDAGIIAGANERSLLIAVYRYLSEQGVAFLKPGRDGESVPRVSSLGDVRILSMSSHKYRGVCMEGGNSLQNVLDMIDFLPKLGLSAYHIQFKVPHTFFEKWYAHRENDYLAGEAVTPRQVAGYVAELERETAKRGIVYHAVGHGWTTEALGQVGTGWDPIHGEITPEQRELIAELDGKREFHLGVPIDTNLCYTNPRVLDEIADEVVEFVKLHPAVDILHIWLADNFNNFCECDQCVKKRPSDHYIRLLNHIDERLAGMGSPVKLCFLAYFDLLWPPVTERFINPGRFIFMFAPITRTYQTAFALKDGEQPAPIPPFVQNWLSFPVTAAEYMAFLNEWKEVFSGERFIYDYHYMWYFFLDLGGFQISRVLSRDIENLRAMGFSGLISCQNNRCATPTGFGLTLCAKKLWDETASFEKIRDEYFDSAFGKDAGAVIEYLERLSGLCLPPMLRENVTPAPEDIEGFGRIPGLVDGFEPVILDRLSRSTGTAYRNWRGLWFNSKLARLMTPMYLAHARGDRPELLRHWERVKAFAMVAEPDVQQDFDLYWFIVTVERSIGLRPKFE